MAEELSEAKGSVAEAAAELGLDAGRISKWRKSFKKPDLREKLDGLTDDQKLIRQLERELREVKLEYEILKKAVRMRCSASFPGANGTVPIYKTNEGTYPVATMCKYLR
jgi:transposase